MDFASVWLGATLWRGTAVWRSMASMHTAPPMEIHKFERFLDFHDFEEVWWGVAV